MARRAFAKSDCAGLPCLTSVQKWACLMKAMNRASGRLQWILNSLAPSANFKWPIKCRVAKGRIESDALFGFEKGFVDAITDKSEGDCVADALASHGRFFIANLEMAVRNRANSAQWQSVAKILARLDVDNVSEAFRRRKPHGFPYGLASTRRVPGRYAARRIAVRIAGTSATPPGTQDAEFEPYINTCRALGWTRIGFDAAEIADSVFQVWMPPENSRTRQPSSCCYEPQRSLGIEGRAEDGDWQNASECVASLQIRQLLSSLWDNVIAKASWRFNGREVAARIAQQLADYCPHLGQQFDAAAFEAALPCAEKYVLGRTQPAICYRSSTRANRCAD